MYLSPQIQFLCPIDLFSWCLFNLDKCGSVSNTDYFWTMNILDANLFCHLHQLWLHTSVFIHYILKQYFYKVIIKHLCKRKWVLLCITPYLVLYCNFISAPAFIYIVYMLYVSSKKFTLGVYILMCTFKYRYFWCQKC